MARDVAESAGACTPLRLVGHRPRGAAPGGALQGLGAGEPVRAQAATPAFRPRFEAAGSYVDKEVILGIRPEHLSRRGIAREGLANADALVELVQPTGSRTFAEFKLGGATIVAELEAHDVQRAGERLELSIDMNRAILIDPTTEKVI